MANIDLYPVLNRLLQIVGLHAIVYWIEVAKIMTHEAVVLQTVVDWLEVVQVHST